MIIDPITAVWIVRLAFAIALAFSVGVVFADVTRRQPPKRKRKPPRWDRLRTDYVINDDHTRLFRVRCPPGALDRVLAKIEDEECCGRDGNES